MFNNIYDDTRFSLSSFNDQSSDDSFHSIPSLNESLNSYFPSVQKNFNVVHINAQSIPAHYPDFLSSFENVNVHAILVSETWFKPLSLVFHLLHTLYQDFN